MQHLESEFDISEGRICDLISEHSDWINSLEKNEISTKQLKDSYPFMSWNYVPPTTLKTTSQLLLNLV